MAQTQFDYGYCGGVNRFRNLDSVGYKLIYILLNDTSKYSDIVWKILGSNALDALSSTSLTRAQKIALIATDSGSDTTKRVFLNPVVSDAWTEQCTFVSFYVNKITPDKKDNGKLASSVEVAIDIVTNSKIGTVLANTEANSIEANPNDFSSDDQPIVCYKERSQVVLNALLALFNGVYLDGIGPLIFVGNSSVTQKTWNTRGFYGYTCLMTMEISGSSETPIDDGEV